MGSNFGIEVGSNFGIEEGFAKNIEVGSNFGIEEGMMKNSKDFPFSGTSLMGYVTASYDELVGVFGKPEFEDDVPTTYEKTSTEWRGQINGHRFTIYDYKWRRRNDSSLEQWHVGGDDPRIIARINQRLRKSYGAL